MVFWQILTGYVTAGVQKGVDGECDEEEDWVLV